MAADDAILIQVNLPFASLCVRPQKDDDDSRVGYIIIPYGLWKGEKAKGKKS